MVAKRTPQAQQDLIEIYLDSARQFGQAQAERYTAELNECIELLASMPLMARERTELRPVVRVHHHSSHVIAYQIDRDDILIVRIVHGRRDWLREFQ
jgi:toxin ParE1/3/4